AVAIIGAAMLVLVPIISGEPIASWSAVTAVLAYFAFVAGAYAVTATWPQYQQWQKEQLAQPIVTMWLEVAEKYGRGRCSTRPGPLAFPWLLHPAGGDPQLRHGSDAGGDGQHRRARVDRDHGDRPRSEGALRLANARAERRYQR